MNNNFSSKVKKSIIVDVNVCATWHHAISRGRNK